MDEFYLERAEQLARAEIEAGIANARKRSNPPPGFDGSCECGLEIPAKRIELGYYRCTDCQNSLEIKGRQYGK